MVGILSGAEQRPPGPRFDFGAELFGSPFCNEESQPHLVAGFPGAVIAEDQHDVIADFGGFLGRDEQVQRRVRRVASRPHFAAHGHVKPGDLPAVRSLHGRRHGNVLRCYVSAVLQASRDGHVELAGQVGVFPVAHEHIGKLPGDGRGVQQFVGSETGSGTADDGANVVHAGLQRNQAHGIQSLPDVRHLLDAELPQLNLLAGGEIGEPLAVVVADAGDGAELDGVADAVGNANPHHKPARGLAPEEDAGPLQAVPVVRGDGLPTFAGERRNVIQDVQAILFRLEYFDFVHGAAPSGRGCYVAAISSITLIPPYCVPVAAKLRIGKGSVNLM